MRWRRSARHATDTMKRLFTPAGGRRRLVLGAFRGVASSPSHGPARNSSRVSGTPLVGGVSATDELLRQVPGAEAATDARPGGLRRPPSRRGRLSRPQKPILAVIELSAEVIPAVEPAVVTVPVAAAPLL